MALKTIPARLQEVAATRPDAVAYRRKVNGSWQPTTWSQFHTEVRQAAKALLNLGIQPEEKTAILGFNRPEWTIFELATMTAAGVSCGIYTTNSPVEVKYVLDHAEASVILVENEAQFDKIRRISETVESLTHCVLMQGTGMPDDLPERLTVLTWEEFIARGNESDDTLVDERLNTLQMEQPAAFIYTSGTTGPPKGVMLSHKNLAWTARVMVDLWKINENDVVLSYLPLSHIAEKGFSINGAISAGFEVNYAESAEKIAANLAEVQPTVLFGVPRVWQRFYDGMNARLAESTGVRAKLVAWARGVATEVNRVRNEGKEPGGFLAAQYGLAQKLVFSKIRTALGLSRTHAFISGAAPIAPHILEFFASVDINIYEVYGQSEGSGPTTANFEGNTRYGTVGKAIPDAEVKLSDEDEILLKGDNVFLGYYKDPEATAATLRDGWLHSGDLGSFDSDGFLTITGRKKDIIITSGGKNIAPKNIEAALIRIPMVSQAVVIGEAKRFITALLTLDETAVESFADTHGIHSDIYASEELRTAIQAGVDETNQEFARVEQVRSFHICHENFSIENGQLTPTMKIKRQVVMNAYEDVIEEMYE